SLFGGYYDSSIKQSNDENYNSYGVTISMPLFDVNRGRTIELRQLEYLQSKLQVADTKVEETNAYQDSLKKIEFLKKKIEIAIDDEKLYDSLVTSTKNLYEAGEKTIYDIDTLKNSKQTMIFDKKIYEIDAQQVLLNLYAKMYGEI
nr:TolC family protein [Sulfurimonas sp.]